MVHDLRQPLDALAIYAELLAQDPTQAVELAPRMVRVTALAQSLARSLQDLVTLRGPATQPVRAVVDVPTLLSELAAVYEPLARHKGLQWRVRGIGAATLVSDAAWLRRVLGNLLANAVRYTAHGGVLLAVRRRAGRIAFEVWDTGPGLVPADQQRVFEPLVRLTAAGERALAAANDVHARLGVLAREMDALRKRDVAAAEVMQQLFGGTGTDAPDVLRLQTLHPAIVQVDVKPKE